MEKNHRTHTVSSDEMTGLQALERNAPSRPMTYGQCEKIEFEYTRHGTLILIGNFQVSTGKLIAPTIGPTRTEAEFASHIEQTVATDPTASWIFVVDNLNIHCSETLVRKVAQAWRIEQPLGKKGVRGVLKSVASRQAFLSERSHRIRFVYTPKHSSWLNQIETIFGMIMRKVIRRGSFTSLADLRSKLLNFIEYFNRVFAKPFQWTYTGRPLRPSQRREVRQKSKDGKELRWECHLLHVYPNANCRSSIRILILVGSGYAGLGIAVNLGWTGNSRKRVEETTGTRPDLPASLIAASPTSIAGLSPTLIGSRSA